MRKVITFILLSTCIQVSLFAGNCVDPAILLLQARPAVDFNIASISSGRGFLRYLKTQYPVFGSVARSLIWPVTTGLPHLAQGGVSAPGAHLKLSDGSTHKAQNSV